MKPCSRSLTGGRDGAFLTHSLPEVRAVHRDDRGSKGEDEAIQAIAITVTITITMTTPVTTTTTAAAAAAAASSSSSRCITDGSGPGLGQNGQFQRAYHHPPALMSIVYPPRL
jgi:hypothetical protein